MANLQEILDERGKTHGDYSHHAHITQKLMQVMTASQPCKFHELHDHEKETLHMIAHKIGRILAGNPHVEDHWRDIAGYATLSADRNCK